MEDIVILKLVFGGLLSAGTAVLLFLAFKIGWRYMVQEKRCTARTTGTVVRYTHASRGGDSSGIRLPIVEYTVNGKAYRITGPQYRLYTSKMVTSFGKWQTEQSYTTDIYSQTFHHRIDRNRMVSFVRNPMAQLFPKDTQLAVYYDPDRPKLAYVLRYCNLKYLFWMLFMGGIVTLLTDLTILFFL